MEIKGKVIAVLPLMSGKGQASGKEWSKQEYVIETVDSEYPKKICFNLWGDRIKQFNIQMGELITVQVDIESREYNGRWYTDVRAWRVDRGISNEQPYAAAPVAGYAAPMPSPATQIAGAEQVQSPTSLPDSSDMGSDLPF
ncbi:hypothetical protein HQ45_07925 [Porphyromonas crevioricanis]|uniref:Domain of uncharacterized function (DUF3127) n=2 Tax=Porphyromonas crevioricanis TaxID=393921 RepID=A0A0A2FGH2_9PORP|nr:DUF3127 domain-containing protein [Porphyromonas crevioricanis]KGN89212.1 hypothetical protein HQ45_07925 [Porphyromonas crevioricanis]KGN96947.1 hypothetical protein HQ38_00055 [Porphyromonas crevioricanis]SJZ99339.1 protein of unknown function [Porphyromonas crevioricanis]SQH72475.1 Domain of uncharacterised function (DUF3127) [Porphyromonas crevioricanis]GAD05227.1 hypothetical protein PORCRE_927 [Porphyromonas crevioricanis JCM 15906]